MASKNNTPYHISYNAPVTLTFSLLAALVLLIDMYILDMHLIPALFIAPSRQGTLCAFNWKSGLDYLKLFTHVLGHADWEHLLANLSFILLLGPLLESKYGSRMLLLMIIITAFVTGVINACFLPTPLMGASGIACMMILLASLASLSQHEIPLTFLLVVVLYFGRELIAARTEGTISTAAHIAGGICGSVFGFSVPAKKASRRRTAARRPAAGTAGTAADGALHTDKTTDQKLS